MVATLADAPHWRNPRAGCPACRAGGITGNFARIVAIVREPRAGQKIRINDRVRSERTSSRGRHQSTRAIRNDRCWPGAAKSDVRSHVGSWRTIGLFVLAADPFRVCRVGTGNFTPSASQTHDHKTLSGHFRAKVTLSRLQIDLC
jgi:hypothetical protein